MDISTHVAGIPCIARVTAWEHQAPLGIHCDSDWDAYGYDDIEFQILDRNGYEAPWLSAKLTAKDHDRICGEFLFKYGG